VNNEKLQIGMTILQLKNCASNSVFAKLA